MPPVEQSRGPADPYLSVGQARVAAAARAMMLAGGPVAATRLGELCWCSARQLDRDFGHELGVSPRAFGAAVQVGRTRELLREASGVAQAIYAAGFGSARGFYETVGPTLGMSPSAYRRGGPGELLRWTVLPTPIGDVVAVAGDLGLALIRIVAAAGPQLPAELAAEFPAAQFERADGELAHVREVLAALAGGRTHPSELPIDVVHTAFQARVWQSLRRIPVAQTRSYAEVAADIDAPRAVRAVGRACATNPVALVVPCHRVVRSDGKLGGYRWGLQVKADLLALENSA